MNNKSAQSLHVYLTLHLAIGVESHVSAKSVKANSNPFFKMNFDRIREVSIYPLCSGIKMKITQGGLLGVLAC